MEAPSRRKSRICSIPINSIGILLTRMVVRRLVSGAWSYTYAGSYEGANVTGPSRGRAAM